MFKGHATKDATMRFHEKAKLHVDQVRSFCEVQVSSIALGTYLGPMDVNTDNAVTQAGLRSISKGVNFIDTAINYRGQRAERSIGELFRRGLLLKAFSREEIFISTKAGFVPYEGVPTNDIKKLFDEQYVTKGIARKNDLIADCHCMEPKYLTNQIDRSRANLSVETIDLYYLHNPETQLEELSARVFYEKLFDAFLAFEQARKEGKIISYGMATWDGFRELEEAQLHLSLKRSIEIAEKAAKQIGNSKHGFAAVQLPFNLAMPEAAFLASQRVSKHDKLLPFLSAAKEYGIDVAVSVPLFQGRLCHDLPDEILKAFPENYSQAHAALSYVASFPGVTAMMVGMKSPAHIEHNLEYLKLPKLTKAQLEKAVDVVLSASG